MNIDILFDPGRYGYQACPHCKGYGSSSKDLDGVNICSLCGGAGLVKSEDERDQAGA